MKRFTFLFFFISILLLCVQCRKPKRSEVDKLPPATQSGQNTFGFLLNGQAWMPKGWNGNQPNFLIISDISYSGNLDIRAYRYINHKQEYFSISSFDIEKEGIYPINGLSRIWTYYSSEVTGCDLFRDSSNYVSGFLKITRYDLQNSIVSGEFECKLFNKKTSCDTLRITNGRFDYHF